MTRNRFLIRRSHSAFACAIVAIAGTVTSSALACPTTLSYLADKLPQYDDPSLEQLRQAVLQENVVEAMARARAQGATPAQAAASALELAEKAKEQLPLAESCVRQLNPDPDRAMAELRNGTFKFSESPGTPMSACANQYVSIYYMVVAAKETAIVAACLANTAN